MPTYTVTDPQSGRTLDLTGDSPPTEQELEEIFKTTAPAPSAVSRVASTVKDVGVGFAKGAADSILGPARMLAPIINKMAASRDRRAALPAAGAGNIDLANRSAVKNADGSVSTVRSISINENGKEILIPTVIGGRVVSDDEAIREFHRTGQHLGVFPDVASANAYAKQLHEDQAAGRVPDNASEQFAKKFEATNTAQVVGKAAEFATEVVGPSGVNRITKFLAGRSKKIPLVVDRYMPNVGAAARDAKPINRMAYSPPTERFNFNDLPLHEQMDNLPTHTPGPVPGGGRAQMPPPTAESVSFQDLPLYQQMELLAEKAPSGPIPGGRAQIPPHVPEPSDIAKAVDRLKPHAVGKAAGTKAPTVEEALQAALEEVRRGPAPTKVQLPPSDIARTVSEETAAAAAAARRGAPKAAAPTVETLTKTASEAVDTHLATGDVEQAATAVEQKVKLTVSELVRGMRDRFGSKRAGDMLYGNSKGGGNPIGRTARAEAIKRLAPGESKLPTFALDDMAKRGTPLDDVQKMAERVGRKGESGAINPALLLHGTGAAVGAAAGATQGDTTSDRVMNAAAGGAMGALTTSFIAHAAAQGVPKALQGFVYTSVLSSPGSVTKAYLGGAGAAISVAMEKIAAGDARNGGRILSSLFSPAHFSEIVTAFKNPALSGRAEDAPTLIGRVFEAVNAPAIRAMQRGGVSYDDAVRATLSGTPTTEIGRDVLGLWSRYFPLRLATTLFPRVGVQILERGIERTPLGLMKLKGINDTVSTGTRVARAGMGTAAGAAAYAGSDLVPDWAKPYAAALSATYALPVGLGLAVGKAKSSGKNTTGQWMAGTQEVARNLPFPQYGPADALNPAGALSAMAVPNILRDIARAKDPQERTTAGIPFGRAKAKIPGLRETLPATGRAVNIAGQPNEPKRGPVQRFFNPAAKENVPFKDVPERVASELQRLKIPINVPSFEKEIEVGKRKIAIPPDIAERARVDRRQFLIPHVEKLLDSPAYNRADDARKAVLLKAVIARAEAAGSQKSRGNVVKLLRQQGAFKR